MYGSATSRIYYKVIGVQNDDPPVFRSEHLITNDSGRARLLSKEGHRVLVRVYWHKTRGRGYWGRVDWKETKFSDKMCSTCHWFNTWNPKEDMGTPRCLWPGNPAGKKIPKCFDWTPPSLFEGEQSNV